jgi:hypothetical protein
MQPNDDLAVFAIGELPDELLLEIIGYFTPIRGFQAATIDEQARQGENGSRIRSLYSLALTCNHLHTISQPFLYQAFIQPPRGEVCKPAAQLPTSIEMDEAA